MIARSVRSALDEAKRRDVVLEAVSNIPLADRGSAERRVPAGGMLVKHDDGRFLSLACVPRGGPR